MNEATSIGELACWRTATNLEAFLDGRAQERDGSAAYESSLVVRLAATEHPYRTRRVDLMVDAIRRVLRAHPSSSELGEDCDRHQSWARIAIVIRAGRGSRSNPRRAHLELDAQIVREQTDHRRDGALNKEASLVLTVAVGDAPDGERRFRPNRKGT
jgi:hypothetical protein